MTDEELNAKLDLIRAEIAKVKEIQGSVIEKLLDAILEVKAKHSRTTINLAEQAKKNNQ